MTPELFSKEMEEATAKRAYLVTAEVPAHNSDVLDTIVPGAIKGQFAGSAVKVTVQGIAWDGQPSYQAATRYAITAQLRTHDGEYSGGIGLPYFELNSVVHGLRDEAHAAEVARAICDPLGIHGDDLRGSAARGVIKGEAVEPEAGDEGPCSCGEPGWWSLDPYALDMTGEDLWDFWCDDCYHQAVRNI